MYVSKSGNKQKIPVNLCIHLHGCRLPSIVREDRNKFLLMQEGCVNMCWSTLCVASHINTMCTLESTRVDIQARPDVDLELLRTMLTGRMCGLMDAWTDVGD